MPARHRVDDITLEGRFDSIKTDAVMSAAHQGDIFRMRPAQRHGRTRGQPASHSPQIFGVPQLLADHAPFIGELFHGGNKRLGIASRSEFVMAALARQNRPRTADPGPIESAAVILLSIAIVIVAAPARALRQVAFEQAIHDRNGVPHEGIVRGTDAQPHQVKKIAADHVPGGLDAAAIGDCEHRGVRVGVRIGRRRISGIDANVMAPEPFDQFTGRGDSPFLKVGGQPVRIHQNKIRRARFAVLLGELGGTNQAGNHRGERRGGIARIFLPAFLGGHRSLPDEIPRGPGNHDARIESAQGNAFTMQPPRQQDGGRHFIELHTAPIGVPIDPAILWESAIRPLNGRQPDQSAQRSPGLARSQEGGRALRQVAGPDQVITAQIVVAPGLAPRDAH